jgi:predicted membrane channel-forming protein YqfA (hemolysin III family)
MEMPRISLYITSFFLLIPFVTAVSLQIWIGALLSFLLLVGNIIFFGFEKKDFLFQDYLLTVLDIFYSGYLLYLANFPAFSAAIFFILNLCGIYFLYEGRRTDFDDYHGIWHIFVALATTFSYIGY